MAAIRLSDAAKWYQSQPHQMAAWNWLQEQLTAEQLAEFGELYRSAPAVKLPLQQELRNNPLKVPFYNQRDSQIAGQAWRMCFSSSCAMLLETLRPGTLKGANGDDQYLKRVLSYGDTTDANAQLRALSSFGVKAKFITTADFADLERQIDRGIPVPCGFLHHGNVQAPSGGGHWLCVIGYTGTHVIVNDPWGEMNVADGSYNAAIKGSGLAYSRKNWGPRWLADGPRSGWAIIAER